MKSELPTREEVRKLADIVFYRTILNEVESQDICKVLYSYANGELAPTMSEEEIYHTICCELPLNKYLSLPSHDIRKVAKVLSGKLQKPHTCDNCVEVCKATTKRGECVLQKPKKVDRYKLTEIICWGFDGEKSCEEITDAIMKEIGDV